MSYTYILISWLISSVQSISHLHLDFKVVAFWGVRSSLLARLTWQTWWPVGLADLPHRFLLENLFKRVHFASPGRDHECHPPSSRPCSSWSFSLERTDFLKLMYYLSGPYLKRGWKAAVCLSVVWVLSWTIRTPVIQKPGRERVCFSLRFFILLSFSF